MTGGAPSRQAQSHSGRFDPDMVSDTITALLRVMRRRNKHAGIDLEDPIDAEMFCQAYEAMLGLVDEQADRIEAGAVIADLVAIREEKRSARGQGGTDQQAGGPDRIQARKAGAST